MAVKVPLDALKNWQRFLFSYMYNSARIRLFDNAITVGPATVYADFHEASYAGYAALTTSGWTNPSVDDGSGRAISTANAVIFTPAVSSGAIYGWYLVNQVGGGPEFYMAENFAGAPITFSLANPLALTVSVTVKSEF